jgi:two-component system chemotaxis sensor kinase CheA
MADRESEFQQRLLGVFRIEAREHLDELSRLLLELEHRNDEAERCQHLEALFRAVHSLKGAARAVQRVEMETACHALESLCAALKSGERELSPALFDTLHESVNELGALLEPDHEKQPLSAEPIATSVEPIATPRESLTVSPEVVQPKASVAPPASADTVRIAQTKLDALLMQAEELVSVNILFEYLNHELRDLHAALQEREETQARLLREIRSLLRDLDKKDNDSTGMPERGAPPRRADGEMKGRNLMPENLLERLGAEELSGRSLAHRAWQILKTAEADRRTYATLLDGLLSDAKQASMLPFVTLLELFPKMTRDLARDQRKQVELAVEAPRSRRIAGSCKSSRIL